MPPLLLGLPGDSTHANYAEANRALYRQTVLPLVQRSHEALARWLGEAFAVDLTVALDLDAIEELSEDRARLWSRVLSAGELLTDAEKRVALGYPAEKPPAQEA